MLVTNKLLSYGAARRELACSKRASDSNLRHSFLLAVSQGTACCDRDRLLLLNAWSTATTGTASGPISPAKPE
jgi:hypothetical protein